MYFSNVGFSMPITVEVNIYIESALFSSTTVLSVVSLAFLPFILTHDLFIVRK